MVLFAQDMLLPLKEVTVDTSVMAGLIKIDLHLAYVNNAAEVDAYFEYPLRPR